MSKLGIGADIAMGGKVIRQLHVPTLHKPSFKITRCDSMWELSKIAEKTATTAVLEV